MSLLVTRSLALQQTQNLKENKLSSSSSLSGAQALTSRPEAKLAIEASLLRSFVRLLRSEEVKRN